MISFKELLSPEVKNAQWGQFTKGIEAVYVQGNVDLANWMLVNKVKMSTF